MFQNECLLLPLETKNITFDYNGKVISSMKSSTLLFCLIISVLTNPSVSAQSAQPIGANYRGIVSSSLFSITRSSNSRMGAFGDIGAVSSGFYFDAGLSQNPAGLASSTSYLAGIIAYNPEKSIGVDDFDLTDLKGFYSNGKNHFGLNFRFYDMGEVSLTDAEGNPLSPDNPYEALFQASWAHRFSDKFSAGVSMKYIRSSFGKKATANGVAFDFGFQWNNERMLNESIGLKYAIGSTLNNLGPKLDYGNGNGINFLPSTLRIGFLINPEVSIDEELKLNFDLAYQVDKILAPTPPVYEYDDSGNLVGIQRGYDPNISSFKAIYQSFYDAPGGVNEELNELIHKFGFETRLNYSDLFFAAIRVGKVLEHKSKGVSSNSIGFGFGAFGFIGDVQFLNYDIDTRFSNQSKTWVASVGYRARISEMFRF